MTYSPRLRLYLPFARCAFWLALALSLPIAGMQGEEGRVALPQARRAAIAGADAGELPSSQPVPSITIVLKRSPAQQADLQAYLVSVRTVGSTDYHHWLTPTEFAQRFAPSTDNAAKVRQWLTSQGLSASAVAPGGTRITASGSVAQANAAFGVSLHRSVTATGDAVLVKGDVSVPQAMADSVASVSGLDRTAGGADPVASLEASVDAGTSPVVPADFAMSTASPQEVNDVLEQASAQGQTVVALHVPMAMLPSRAVVLVAANAALPASADTADNVTPRPGWQVAAGLPDDSLRAVPDAMVADGSALAAALASVAAKSGRQGEIAPRLYTLAVQPGIFTHTDAAAAAGSWTSADGLGMVNADALAKALETGATNPLSSVIELSSRNVMHGQGITLTATIKGGSGTPTGSVTFASAQGGTVGSAAMTDGVATLTTNTLAGGQYGFYGTYSGDSTYAQSTTNVDTATVQPEAAKVAAGVTGMPLVGTSMPVTVTVTSPSGIGTPSGMVTVHPYGTALGQQAFTGTLGASSSGTATATVMVPATNAGSFTFQASCTTDASFSCAEPVPFPVTIGKGTPVFTLTQTGTASAATLTASVTAPATGGSSVVAPTGSVQFLDNGMAVGSGTLNSSGVATYTGALGSGSTHIVTANYAGDANYNIASASANATSTKVTPTVTLTNSSTTANAVALSAAVTSSSSTTPTGTVQFLDGTVTIGTGALNAGGVATFSGALAGGAAPAVRRAVEGTTTHTLTALYTGDANFNPATSNAVTVTQQPVDVSVVLSPSTTDGIAGQNITLTASLGTGVSNAILVPTGTVTFYDTYNGALVNLGTAALASSGMNAPNASLSTTALRAGTHNITAAYSGDANFLAETTAPVEVRIGDFSLSFAPSAPLVTQGASAMVTVSVAGEGGFNGAIALACTPPASTDTACSIMPATVNAGSNATLTITTTKASAAMALRAEVHSHMALAAASAGLLAFLLPGSRRRRAASLLLLLLTAMLASGGCSTASSSTGSGTDGGTPLGTLTFSVTGTAVDAPIAARRTAVLSVTVQ